MTAVGEQLSQVLAELPGGVALVAVSKTHSVETILQAYHAGQRIFGENRVQELSTKQPLLPDDIQWHMIGHLQTNKVKYIAPFISMIQSVDSFRLLQEISRQALRCNRVIDCLLEMYIATEESKFGLDQTELSDLLEQVRADKPQGIRIRGLMGMASFTNDMDKVRAEFRYIREIFRDTRESWFSDKPWFNQLSIGMSGDYRIALEEGSTMVRIGTRIFGSR